MVTETQSPSPLPQVILRVGHARAMWGRKQVALCPNHITTRNLPHGVKFHDSEGLKKGFNLRFQISQNFNFLVGNLSSYFSIVRCAELLNIPTATGLKNHLKRSSILFVYNCNSALKFVIYCNEL